MKIDGKVSKKRLFVTDECLLAFNTNDPDKITDLAIYGSGSRNLPYLQLEVQSSAKPVSEGPSKSKKPAIDGSRKSTIRKLGYSLVDQLIFFTQSLRWRAPHLCEWYLCSNSGRL